MNNEIPYDVEERKNELWEAFCKRYPLITSTNRFKRAMVALFCEQTSDELSFTNGYYQGFHEGIKRRLQYVPPAPKAGPLESPEPPASPHSQGGDFPDEDLSK